MLLKVSDGTEMLTYCASPSESGTYPGIIIFQEAFGVNSHIRDITERFARQGYVAIAPELYHRTAPARYAASYTDFQTVTPHMQAMTNENMEADIRATWDWLTHSANVKSESIACIGYCMGGRVSFLANAILPFKAAVSYYGGRIVPDLVKQTPSLHAPMLFFWGGLDKHIPQEQIMTVTAELRKAEKQFINVEISYADHGFNCNERASYNEQAAKESWALTLAFLEQKLGIKTK